MAACHWSAPVATGARRARARTGSAASAASGSGTRAPCRPQNIPRAPSRRRRSCKHELLWQQRPRTAHVARHVSRMHHQAAIKPITQAAPSGNHRQLYTSTKVHCAAQQLRQMEQEGAQVVAAYWRVLYVGPSPDVQPVQLLWNLALHIQLPREVLGGYGGVHAL
jgi:hypothetical protein